MRKQIFVIAAILRSTLGVTAICAGVFLLLQWSNCRTLGRLRQARLDPPPLYFAIGPHFTPKGHQVTAELLHAATKDIRR